MPPRGKRVTGSGRGSVAWYQATSGGLKPPDVGVRGFQSQEHTQKPANHEDTQSVVEWPSHSTLTERAVADSALGISFRIVESSNLGTDAEINALKEERERLIRQCEAAGIDTTPRAMSSRPMRALHPSAAILPVVTSECMHCLELKRHLQSAQDAYTRAHKKSQLMLRRHIDMVKTQQRYRDKINSLYASLGAANDRLTRAGLPTRGPVRAPKKDEPNSD